MLLLVNTNLQVSSIEKLYTQITLQSYHTTLEVDDEISTKYPTITNKYARNDVKHFIFTRMRRERAVDEKEGEE